jgi:predicted enzyme related to lactoylglutathione lyase
MGYPVVHFEVCGKDPAKQNAFFSELFDWKIDAANPLNYGIVDRESNLNSGGIGIGGGICDVPPGYDGHVTFYVEVPNVGASLAQAEQLGGTRVMGPESPMEGLVIGLFTSPSGQLVGVIQAA